MPKPGKRIWYHIAFCIAVIVIRYAALYYYFGGFREANTWWTVLSGCIFFLVCIYVGRWLCMRWYLKNKYFLFALNTVLACTVLTVAWWLVFIFVFNRTNAEITELFMNEMPFFIIGIAGGIMVKLIRVSMQKQLHDANLAKEQKQGELNLLQSQLSPHFLFNTLNNLYGISVTQHQRIPALLLKLSDLLRYSVYDTKKPFVPLKDELEYINNYIDFEKIRNGERLVLKIEVENSIPANIAIAPMVLIVFIENAFKHAKNTFDEKIYIDISLMIEDSFILFTVKNSYSKTGIEKSLVNEESSGLGLANTIKRLDLLYGDDYKLHQSHENNWYTVQLKVKVKQW